MLIQLLKKLPEGIKGIKFIIIPKLRIKYDFSKFDGSLRNKIFKLISKIYMKIKNIIIAPNKPISDKI